VLERDQKSLTRILEGLDTIEADLDATDALPLDIVEVAAARHPDARDAAT
jgi:hypothetical protein